MDEDEEEVVPLPNVNSAILKKVIQWANYHKDDPPPPEDDENKEKRTDDISSWDADFLKVDQGTLFELILVGPLLLHSFFSMAQNHTLLVRYMSIVDDDPLLSNGHRPFLREICYWLKVGRNKNIIISCYGLLHYQIGNLLPSIFYFVIGGKLS